MDSQCPQDRQGWRRTREGPPKPGTRAVAPRAQNEHFAFTDLHQPPFQVTFPVRDSLALFPCAKLNCLFKSRNKKHYFRP